MSDASTITASAAVQRVAERLRALAHPHPPVVLTDAARTAQQAADALGVSLGQIAKSIVFRLGDRPEGADRTVLVVTSGDRRVDEHKVQALVCSAGGRLHRADAAFIKAGTGFSIGGVSPLGHLSEPVLLIDQDLFRFDVIWAAAGHPHAVFQLTPQALQRYTGAPVADVTVAPA